MSEGGTHKTESKNHVFIEISGFKNAEVCSLEYHLMRNFVTGQLMLLWWCKINEDEMGWACDLDGRDKDLCSIFELETFWTTSVCRIRKEMGG